MRRRAGEAIAVRFAREGAAGVVVNDLNPETAGKTAELVKEAGSRALVVAGSVMDEAFVVEMMERAVKAGFYQKMPDEKIIYAP